MNDEYFNLRFEDLNAELIREVEKDKEFIEL